MKRWWLFLICAFIFGACVTINEPVFSPQSIVPGQRTILAVYPSPGPWVVSESESKAESAAKTMPLFSSVVQSFQDDRDKAAAAELQQYLPPWRPGDILAPLLLSELANAGFPGRLIPVAESELDAATVRGFNRAADPLEWQRKYFYGNPTQPLPRDYSRFLSLDDALVFEADLLPHVAADDDGNMVPTLAVSSRLLRCQTMHLLWKHEDKVEDKDGARSMYEFKTLPQQLVDRWKALMPALAKKIAESMRAALGSSSVGAQTVP